MTGRRLDITIEHDAASVPFGSFMAVSSKAMAMLRGIDCRISGQAEPTARWGIVACSMDSPLRLTVECSELDARRQFCNPIQPFIDDWNRLERGEPPRYLSPQLQQTAKELVGVLGRGIRSVRFVAEGQEARPTQRVAEYVDALAHRCAEIGSLEGRLDVISVHGGRDSVKVWDRRFNVAVVCRVSDAQLEEAKDALGKRVLIRGRIVSRAGRPQAMADVFDIRVLRDVADLPQPDEIGPIELTGEEEPADHLRGIPDDG